MFHKLLLPCLEVCMRMGMDGFHGSDGVPVGTEIRMLLRMGMVYEWYVMKMRVARSAIHNDILIPVTLFLISLFMYGM